MPPPRIEVPPELMAEGKYLYEETLTPIDAICARMGLSSRTFFWRVKEWNWVRRRYNGDDALTMEERLPPAQNKPATELAKYEALDSPQLSDAPAIAANMVSENVSPENVSSEKVSTEDIFFGERASADERTALYARVVRAAQLQMDAIERVQKMLCPTHALQSERTVRIIATLNKTLCAIAAIAKPDKVTLPDETDDDPIPRDIDEFRYELARRLKGLVDTERRRAGKSSRGT